MILIAAADKNWAIGHKGQLLYSLPDDMRFFRETTKGAVVIMGRATLESLPGGRPLPNRRNIVLSRSSELSVTGAEVYGTIDEVLFACEGEVREVFVIGGEAVYRAFLEHCDTAYITKIDAARPADRFFPNLDEISEWQAVSRSETHENNGVSFSFVTYKKNTK